MTPPKLQLQFTSLTHQVKEWLWRLLRITGLAYIVFALIIFFGQESLVFVPSRSVTGSPQDLGLTYSNVKLKTEDGVQLSAWFVPAQGNHPQTIPHNSQNTNPNQLGNNPSSRNKIPLVILFCHGNGGNISHRLSYLPIFQSLGLSTLLFDYRGYGDSEGKPSENGTYQDVAAAWRYLIAEQQIPPQNILIYGESLGGAVASYWAETLTALPPLQQAKGLILASTFSHINDRAAELYPFLPVRFLSRVNYGSESRLPNIKMPVLVIHSRDDEIIPFHHGQKLYNAARPLKLMTIIHGTHNEGFLDSLETYRQGLGQFMQLVNVRDS